MTDTLKHVNDIIIFFTALTHTAEDDKKKCCGINATGFVSRPTRIGCGQIRTKRSMSLLSMFK